MNIQALADGIETTQDARGHVVYLVPCASCGEKVQKKAYRGKETCLCAYCQVKAMKKTRESKYKDVLKTQSKAEVRFEKAVKEIQRQVSNFETYEKPISIARTRLEKYGSIPEAMVAIELIRLKYSIVPQQKVKRYRIDFVIPKEKYIIEIDGVVFHDKITEREAEIQFAFGLDWKIIHIPAEMIRKNIQKLDDVIKTMTK